MLQMLQIKHCFGWNHSSQSVPNQQMEVPPIRVPPKYTVAGGCPSFEFMHTLTHRFSDPQSYATSGLLVHWDQPHFSSFFHGKDMKTSTATKAHRIYWSANWHQRAAYPRPASAAGSSDGDRMHPRWTGRETRLDTILESWRHKLRASGFGPNVMPLAVRYSCLLFFGMLRSYSDQQQFVSQWLILGGRKI